MDGAAGRGADLWDLRLGDAELLALTRPFLRSGTLLLVGAVLAAIGLGVLAESLAAPVTRPVAVPGANAPCTTSSIALPPGTRVPSSDLASVAFVRSDLAYGLTLGAIGCLGPSASQGGGNQLESEPFPVRLARSTDDGKTFSVVGGALPATVVDQFGGTDLVFLDARRGFLLASGTLFSTGDGGARWQEVSLGRPVAALAAFEGRAVVLTAGDWQLWWSSGSGGAFVRRGTGAPLPATGTTASLVADGPAGRIYLLPFVAGRQRGDLLVSGDGGSTWQEEPAPCASPYLPTPIALTAAPGRGLGLLCGGVGAAGSAPRAFYTSSDGGSSWTLQASAQPGVLPDPSGLPLQDFGNVLAAPRAGTFLLTTADGLFASTDSGAHWRELGDVDLAGAGGTSSFGFLGAGRGFLLTPDAGLYVTTDGRTFRAR